MYSLRVENCDDKELEQFESELRAPIMAFEIEEERRVKNWLRG